MERWGILDTQSLNLKPWEVSLTRDMVDQIEWFANPSDALTRYMSVERAHQHIGIYKIKDGGKRPTRWFVQHLAAATEVA